MSFGWGKASKGAIGTNRSGLHEFFQPGELETARVVRLATTYGFSLTPGETGMHIEASFRRQEAKLFG